jgi:hypothetical protein
MRSVRSSAQPPPEPAFSVVCDRAVAAAAFAAADLVVWERRVEPIVDAYVAQLLPCGTFDLAAEGSAAEAALDIGSRLPPGRGRAELIADMRALAELLSRDLGFGRILMRLELLDRDACRLFHVDRVTLRLLTTYAGPGTQFLTHLDVMRDGLGRGDNARIIRPGATIRELATGWVGLFRGERDPALRGRGVVHRSPPIRADGRRRLVFKVEPVGEIAC